MTPVGADFGYAEVTLAACDDSPRHQLPPSPSPRFQPSPQPYLQQLPPCSPKPYAQQPPPPSSCKPPPPRPPPPRPSSKLCLPSSSSSSSDPCRFPPPALSSCRPYPQAPPRTNPPQSHPHSPASQSQACVRQDLDESTKELPVGVKEPPQRADLVVKKNVGQDVGGEALTESPAVSCSGTMGDSKENKSPRSSTSENLQTLSLKEHYEIERELGRGTYGKVSWIKVHADTPATDRNPLLFSDHVMVFHLVQAPLPLLTTLRPPPSTFPISQSVIFRVKNSRAATVFHGMHARTLI